MYIRNAIQDALLNELTGANIELVICSAEPSTYAEANSTFNLGRTAITTSGPKNTALIDGREITVGAINNGAVTANGTATHWALIDTGTLFLLYANALAEEKDVSIGTPFTMDAFDIVLRDEVG